MKLKLKVRLKLKLFLLILALNYILTNFCYSAFSNNRNWNTRAKGMGGAYTAVSDDSGAVLYNPAGLENVKHSELYLFYTKPFNNLDGVDLETQYISFIQPLGFGTISANYYSFQNKELYFENTAGIQYGFRPFIILDLNLGLGVNFLEHGYKNVDKEDPVFSNSTKASGYGVDLGLMYDFENFSVGASAKNINNPDVGLKSEDKVPTDYRIGVAFKTDKLTFPIDLAYRDQKWGSENDNKISKHFGFEWKFSEMIAVRAGLNDYEKSMGFSYMQPKMFGDVDLGVDYAFSIPKEIQDTVGTHQFSLTMRFGYQDKMATDVFFVDYQKIHPKFSIKKGISSVSNNTVDLLFDNKLVYRFYAVLDGLSQNDRALDLAYKLSELMKFNSIFDDDIKVIQIKSSNYVLISEKIYVNVDSDAMLLNANPKDLAKTLQTSLKAILVIPQNKKPETFAVGDKIKVEKAYTVIGEIANIYVRGKKVFTIYTGVMDPKDTKTTVLDKAMDFAKTMSLYVDDGLSAMIIGSSTLYDNYYITIRDRNVFYINSEAEFLGVDKNKLLVEYQEKLYSALLK